MRFNDVEKKKKDGSIIPSIIGDPARVFINCSQGFHLLTFTMILWKPKQN